MSFITTAIVVAAGNGKRMKNAKKKPFIELCGKPILTYCLDVFEKSNLIDNIILVANTEDHKFIQESIIDKYGYTIIEFAEGGETRQESVYNGLMKSPYCDIVLIHDAARPFVDEDIISRSIADAHDFGASVVCAPAINTIKTADDNGFVDNTLNRIKAWEAQTPQTFRAKLFLEAAEYAKNHKIVCTDDACLVESFGLKVKITIGNDNNIKITTMKDLFIAQRIVNTCNI